MWPSRRVHENTSDVSMRLTSGRLVKDRMVSRRRCAVSRHTTWTTKSVVPPRQ
ncbi:hypothetical protein SAMN05443572_101162 [Myxococcus fulvus]|uniref:Uncharacterized protein n=1 Tax=Myxococcus fulvus TaxID=33 RepID=A0ABY1BVH6_MYXFU|nr:hypothetical protein SAMN05443572_101162 [Myxococcus fulvus]